mgnify:CR=1 FL=1
MRGPILFLTLLAVSSCGMLSGKPSIPEALQGRWGINEADCEPGRSDAKGLMEVGEETLTFYESRAVLSEAALRSDSMIEGAFAFTGEGMSWSKVMRLRVSDGGNRLIRDDMTGDEAPMTLIYGRCGRT